MIIGLTGTMAAGKTTVARMLVDEGFTHLTYSDILRKVAKEKGIEPTREALQKLGTTLKNEQGPAVLSKMLLARDHEDIVADGIRTLPEIEELKLHGAVIWAVVASAETRFSRLKSRGRSGDPQTLEEFKKLDEIENSGSTSGQDINACVAAADATLENEETLEALEEQVQTELAALAEEDSEEAP
ncbi:MAG: dephospho-CoA kinase [Nanoarchaeota archaeon]|nr:dephospho-CoA kinase [Nanoarchaeota archaeon]